MSYKIEYLDCTKNFRHTEIFFDDHDDAVKWGRENLPNFHMDMVRIIF